MSGINGKKFKRSGREGHLLTPKNKWGGIFSWCVVFGMEEVDLIWNTSIKIRSVIYLNICSNPIILGQDNKSRVSTNTFALNPIGNLD